MKDMMGKPVMPGDTIALATRVGNTAVLKHGVVTKLVEKEHPYQSYGETKTYTQVELWYRNSETGTIRQVGGYSDRIMVLS